MCSHAPSNFWDIACTGTGVLELDAELLFSQLLLDIPDHQRARWEHITPNSVAGRGAFGTVLTVTWRGSGIACPVAVKALQPVAPPGGDVGAMLAYKVGYWL